MAAGWLERPARGVVQAPAGELTWETVLDSLQHLMRSPLHVGGRSALELHGYGPNLAPGAPTSVIVDIDEPLPSWLHQLPDMPVFEARTIAPLFPFADRHAQPCRERLESDRIDLGTGNRTLVANGRLDPTYRITYPRGLDSSG